MKKKIVKHYITPTLLNSFSYYFKYEGDKEEENRQDFLRTLSKERFEPNKAMQRGIDFENDVQAYCENKFNDRGVFDINGGNQMTSQQEREYLKFKPYANCVKNIGNICKGGLWQVKVKKDIVINGITFLLYGKCDVIKEDWIHDIKTTGKYDIGKYQDSAQHLFYLFCGDMKKFSYLIAQGGTNLNTFYKEDYFYTKDTEQQLITKINTFLEFLENDKEAKDLYYDKWKCKY